MQYRVLVDVDLPDEISPEMMNNRARCPCIGTSHFGISLTAMFQMRL